MTRHTVKLDGTPLPGADDFALGFACQPVVLLAHRPLGRAAIAVRADPDYPRPVAVAAVTVPAQARHDLDPGPDRGRLRTCPPRRDPARPPGRATGRRRQAQEELDRGCQGGRQSDRGQGRGHLEWRRQGRRDARDRRLDQPVRRRLRSPAGVRAERKHGHSDITLSFSLSLSPLAQVLVDRHAAFCSQGRVDRQPTTSRHARLYVLCPPPCAHERKTTR